MKKIVLGVILSKMNTVGHSGYNEFELISVENLFLVQNYFLKQILH